ncbi:hypothetical protein [Paenibacillus taiwanensis]|uniref:hypothetical protein n=1 Tax=Paenibacillus taiwanensis TaxID=401638 RepID=UPI0004250C8F|nr:hypothetical protein [Paenibacillus taiwanensis]
MTDWMGKVWTERMDQLMDQAEQLSDIQRMKVQSAQWERRIMAALESEHEQLMKDFIHLQLLMAQIQKEWLYARGLQDGAKMLAFAMKSEM